VKVNIIKRFALAHAETNSLSISRERNPSYNNVNLAVKEGEQTSLISFVKKEEGGKQV